MSQKNGGTSRLKDLIRSEAQSKSLKGGCPRNTRCYRGAYSSEAFRLNLGPQKVRIRAPKRRMAILALRRVCTAALLLIIAQQVEAVERPTPQEWRAYNRAGPGAYYLCRPLGRMSIPLHSKIGGPVKGIILPSDEIVLWGAAYDSKRALWYRTSSNMIPVGRLNGWFRASAVDCTQQSAE